MLSSKVTAADRILFYLPDSMELEIVAGDFFGTGKLPNPAWSGPFLIEHRWSSEETRCWPARVSTESPSKDEGR